MRAMPLMPSSESSLLASYASRMSSALLRKRAEMDVRAARADAEQVIKARSEFLANMNHELRTPLNAIIGFAQMLRDGAKFRLDDQQRAEYVDYILQSADLLLGHINTLLDVAALESGGLELDRRNIDLSHVVAEAAERARIRADAANVSIERRGGASVRAWADGERVAQALDHVLKAAVKASREGGRILIRAALDDRGAPEIAVRDEGQGMSEEDIARALDVFAQVHRGLDQSFAQPGVNYAIAKTFAEMQGGRFAIKSKPGKGTLIRIALPPARAETRPADAAVHEPLETSHAA